MTAEATVGGKDWSRMIAGICAVLREGKLRIVGADVLIGGDLPMGAGLASSAALHVGLADMFLAVARVDWTKLKIAKLCQDAERRSSGVPCGLMDQLACLYGERGRALFIDCRDLAVTPVPWPGSDYAVVIVDSRSPHRLSQSQYGRRVEESAAAIRSLSREYRDISMGELAVLQKNCDPLLFRRARHVVSEIARTEQAANAVRGGDIQSLGRLINESHRSLAEDYEVSSPRMDDLAGIVRSVPGCYGARITGAGFGGCVVAVAEARATAAIEAAVRARYDPKYGVVAPVWAAQPAAGAEVQIL